MLGFHGCKVPAKRASVVYRQVAERHAAAGNGVAASYWYAVAQRLTTRER